MEKYFVCLCGEILLNNRTEKYQICPKCGRKYWN